MPSRHTSGSRLDFVAVELDSICKRFVISFKRFIMDQNYQCFDNPSNTPGSCLIEEVLPGSLHQYISRVNGLVCASNMRILRRRLWVKP